MPPAVAAVAIVAVKIAVTYLVTNALLAAVITIAATIAITMLAKKPKNSNRLNQGAELKLKVDPQMPRQVMVGPIATGGSSNWAFTRTDDFKKPNRYLYRVITLSDRPLHALTAIMENKNQLTFSGDVTTGWRACNQHRNKKGQACMWVRVYLGSDTPVADATLVSESGGQWTSAHKGVGIAYAIVKCDYDADAFPNSEPDLTFIVEGAHLYDDRKDGSMYGSGTHRVNQYSTWEYSDTTSIIIAQLLRGFKTNGKLIVGVQAEERDLSPSMIFSAHNTCEQLVASDAGNVKRYRSGMILTASESAADMLLDLQAAMDGKVLDRGGSITILPGATRTPVLNLTDQDIIWSAEKSWQPKPSLQQMLNHVTGNFISSESNFQEKDFPRLANAQWELDDGGERFSEFFSFRAIVHDTQVQRVTKRIHQASRYGGTAAFVCPIWALEMEQGDWFTLTTPRWDMVSKYFEAAEVNILSNLWVAVIGREVNPAIDGWNPAVDQKPRTDTTWNPPAYDLPIPDIAPVGYTNVDAATGAQSYGIRVGLTGASLTLGAFVTGIEVQYATQADQANPLASSGVLPLGQNAEFAGLKPGTNYSVRARSTDGSRYSDWGAWVNVGTAAATQIPISGVAGAGDLAERDNIYFGSPYLKEADGGVNATNANYKTNQGTAAFLNNQGQLATANAANWQTQVSGTGKPADFAGTTLNLYAIGTGTVDIRGNQATLVTNNEWTASVLARESFTNSAFVRARSTGGYYNIVGLTTDKTPINGAASTVARNTYQITAAVIYGWVRCYANGVLLYDGYPAVAPTVNSVMAVIYTGQRVIFMLDSVVIASAVAPAGLTLTPRVDYWYNGAAVSDLAAGPYGDTNVYRDDGITKMTQVEYRTAEGTAAFLNNQGLLATKNTANFATDVSGVGKPSLYAGSTLNLDPMAPASFRIEGNTIVKLDWGWHSVNGKQVIKGPAWMSFRCAADTVAVIGLRTAKIPNDGADMTGKTFYPGYGNSGQMALYGEAGLVHPLGALAGDPVWMVVYDDRQVTYYRDNVQIHQHAATATGQLNYFVCNFLSGGPITDIQFGAAYMRPDINANLIDTGSGSYTPLTRGQLRTELGTAAFVNNQSYWTTRAKATMSYGDSDLTGFGAVAQAAAVKLGGTSPGYAGLWDETVNYQPTNAQLYTNLGTAAFVNNQSWFTTAPSLDLEDTAHLTNRTRISRLDATTGRAAANFADVNGIKFSSLPRVGTARNGDAVNFGGSLPTVPEVVPLYGGNGPTAGRNIVVQPQNVTVSGFTMRAVEQAVTAGTTYTDGPGVAGGVGEPTLVINRSNGSVPFDGNFTFTFGLTVNNVNNGGPGEPADPGSINVGLYCKQGGAWIQVGTFNTSSSGTYNYTIATTADFGAGNEFGISVISAEGPGTGLNGFTSVKYTSGTVTETNLTPAGISSPIRYMAFLP